MQILELFDNTSMVTKSTKGTKSWQDLIITKVSWVIDCLSKRIQQIQQTNATDKIQWIQQLMNSTIDEFILSLNSPANSF